VRLAVRETLTCCTHHSKRRTVAIVVAKLNPMIVAEIIFRQIPMQMLLAAMLIDAFHPAFEDRKIAFRPVRIGQEQGDKKRPPKALRSKGWANMSGIMAQSW